MNLFHSFTENMHAQKMVYDSNFYDICYQLRQSNFIVYNKIIYS